MKSQLFTRPRFKTKKAFKEAVAAGEEVTIWQHDPCGTSVFHVTAILDIEGSKCHKWYAKVAAIDGKITKVFP